MSIKNTISPTIGSSFKDFGAIADTPLAMLQRYLTTFDRTANTSIDLNIGLDTINDFELEVLFAPTAFGLNNDVMGGDNFSLRVRADGFMLLLLPRTDIDTNPRFFGLGSQAVAGKINKMVVTRSGDNFSATLNESVSDSNSFNDVDAHVDISVVGTAGVFGNTFFDGQIMDVKLWVTGDRNTGTLLRDLPIDGIASETTQDALGNAIIPSNLIAVDSTLYTLVDGVWVDGQGNELEYAY